MNFLKLQGSFPPVLNNVQLEINAGDFIAVTGANGAGKSTLLKLLCALLPIRARELNIKKNQIAYVPQNANPDKKCPLTVKEVLLLGAAAKNGILSKYAKEDVLKAENLIKTFALEKVAHVPCGEISGGEAQKMQIARALMQQPKLLLLDEPFTNLDINAKQTVLKNIVNYYKAQNVAVVLVTHQTRNLPQECNKEIKIINGILQ
jgi:ABC-type Mn2+/Zn2+ transport system ATPase subunit